MAITLEDLALVYTNHLPVDALQLTVADCHDLGYVFIEKSASNLFFSATTKRAEIKQVLKVRSRKRKMKDDRNGN